MKSFPHPQNASDWLTQYWNIVLGRRATPADAWLLGPIGREGGIGEHIIQQVADEEGLRVHRNTRGGLIDDPSIFERLGDTIHPDIVSFYTRTSDYEMEVWTRWEPFWKFFGRMVEVIFAGRIDQLRLPLDSLATSKGITSEIVQLRDLSNVVRHTIWLRKLVSTASVIYSGFYYHVVDMRGETRVKVVFPLPHGSATVVMKLIPLRGGGLRLASSGRHYGDPGFYFVVQDRRGTTWIHYLKAFHEFIEVRVDDLGVLRADHTMRLWGRLCYSLHYRVQKRASGVATPRLS